MHKYISLLSGLLLVCLLSSCEKKILEIIPVLQVEQDLSIAGAKDIRHFTFPTDEVGYAADDSPYIYKTTDGGRTWSKITVGAGGNCQGLEFFDVQNGMCLMGENLFVTENGGQSWTLKTYARFIGLTADGKAVTGSCGNNSCQILVSTNKGKSFQATGQVRLEGSFVMGKVTGSHVYVDGNYIGNPRYVHGLDLNTRQETKLYISSITGYDILSDIFENETMRIVVGNRGQIREDFSYGYSRSYYGHYYDYFSVDGFEDLAIAVGAQTISMNRDYNDDRRWSELLDSQGRSFPQTFYKVRFTGHNKFYISGENGLLWRARI